MFNTIVKTGINISVLVLLSLGLYSLMKDDRVSSLQKNTSKKFNKYQTTHEDGTLSSTIRLLKDGKFTCSGAVISDEYAVTAAHCVSNESGRMVSTITVQDETRSFLVTAETVGLNHRLDYALLYGNFRSFKKFNLDENSTMHRQSLDQLKKPETPQNPLEILMAAPTDYGSFISCGFPMGSNKKFCAEFKMLGDYNFQIVGTGTLYPGMSGGPVFDPETNTIYAVNSAVSGQYAVVAPLIGIISCFDVD